jgi:putative ABC transport system permease protein
MDAAALAALSRTGPEVNLVHVSVDSAALPALNAAVKATPGVASMTLWTEVRANFRETMGENLAISITVYSALGALIAVGVVYNAARIQLSERAHELASLRILGFTRAEVSTILLSELAFELIVAIPIGLVVGYGLIKMIVSLRVRESFQVPVVIEPASYAIAALVVLAAAAASAFVVRRRIDTLDLVAVLKTRD